MKRSVKFTGLLMMFMLCMSFAKAQVRVFVNVNPVIPACRPNVVVPAPRPAPVVYVPANVCHYNCHIHHVHVYNNHYHGHVNHGSNYHNHHHNNGHKGPGYGHSQNHGNKRSKGNLNNKRR